MDKEQSTQEVFGFLPELVTDPASISITSGRIMITSNTKKMMDVYNEYYAPTIGGLKKTQSINCLPCVRKVYLFFVKMKSEIPTS